MSADVFTFNGINGSTGQYLLPPLTPALLARVARGESLEPGHLAEIKWRQHQAQMQQLGVKAGVQAADLAQAGWSMVLAYGADPAVKEALGELIAHRQAQAARLKEGRFQIYDGPRGYRQGEGKDQWLARHKVSPGPVDPDRMPYYVLLVGDPEAIPYSFQYQLDLAYAVGRIHFDTLEEYASYARSVVAAETGRVGPARRAAFWATRNRGDPATALSAEHLVAKLAERLAQDMPAWSVETMVGETATKERLAGLMGGAETPALLFTASHGLAFDRGDARQMAEQGALICQDWPGPGRTPGPISDKHFMAAGDVGAEARLLGLVAFCFACFGAGTPRLDEYAQLNEGKRVRTEIARQAFLAALPRRLLGHPKGGALAVIGHVERAWPSSFMWQGIPQYTVYESTLRRLMEGQPVGLAFEDFNERYAELAAGVSEDLREATYGVKLDELELCYKWMAHNDARGFAVLGDPAVRIPVDGPPGGGRPEIEAVTVRGAPSSPLRYGMPGQSAAPRGKDKGGKGQGPRLRPSAPCRGEASPVAHHLFESISPIAAGCAAYLAPWDASPRPYCRPRRAGRGWWKCRRMSSTIWRA